MLSFIIWTRVTMTDIRRSIDRNKKKCKHQLQIEMCVKTKFPLPFNGDVRAKYSSSLPLLQVVKTIFIFAKKYISNMLVSRSKLQLQRCRFCPAVKRATAR